MEIEEVFNTSDFPVIDAFHYFDPRNIPMSKPISYIHFMVKIKGMSFIQHQRKEASVKTKCSKENILSHPSNISISY